MDSMGLLAFVLLFVGLTIMVTEVFVPSGGMLAVVTTITLSLSLMCAYTAWFERYPVAFYGFCFVALLLVPSTLTTAFVVLPRTSVGKRMLLPPPEPDQLKPHTEHSQHLSSLVGKYGTTLSMLNPGGLVLVDSERLHAVSEGLIVERGRSVIVLEIRGTRVVVRPAEPPLASEQDPSADRDDGSVDFDLPNE